MFGTKSKKWNSPVILALILTVCILNYQMEAVISLT